MIQPSEIRIYTDDQYRQAGALVQEDLSSCPVVFSIKEIPASFFEPEKAYVFFSHTLKGQKHNMPMLKKMMALRCHLIDYEKVVDEKGARLLFFGRHAGLAGMIDSLWSLGKRLDWEGIPNPFASLNQTIHYGSLEEAKQAVVSVGQRIKKEGLTPSLLPFVCGFAGYGHVSRGAQEIFDLLPHKEISPEDMAGLFSNPGIPNNLLYKVVFKEQHLVEPVSSENTFKLQDYYNHPEKYRSRFGTYLPYISLFINAVFWTPRYPRFVTKNNLKDLFETHESPRLRVIGDITCDIDGSVECTVRATQPDNPIFVFDPIGDRATDGYQGIGVVVMAVDNLPCEIPRASSIYFSNTLMEYVPEIAKADFSIEFDNLELSPNIKNGIILYGGKLTPQFQYMDTFLKT